MTSPSPPTHHASTCSLWVARAHTGYHLATVISLLEPTRVFANLSGRNTERVETMGFEPTTFSMPWKCSSVELCPQNPEGLNLHLQCTSQLLCIVTLTSSLRSLLFLLLRRWQRCSCNTCILLLSEPRPSCFLLLMCTPDTRRCLASVSYSTLCRACCQRSSFLRRGLTLPYPVT
jgi:hypothetical protein